MKFSLNLPWGGAKVKTTCRACSVFTPPSVFKATCKSRSIISPIYANLKPTMAKPLPKHINLLDPSSTPKTAWDKVYDWVFGVGRVLIIVVELVVLLAFGSRFWLDRRNNDLKDSIEAKVQILDAQRQFEIDMRKVQQVLGSVSSMLEDQESMATTVDDIMADIPKNVNIESFNLTQTSAVLTCTTSNYAAAHAAEEDIRQNPISEDVNMTVSRSEGGQVEFTITVTLVQSDSAPQAQS